MTKAAVLYEVGKALDVVEVQVGRPRAGEVLVRTASAGVCHSDLHVMHGDLPSNLPVVIGHEGSGVVEEIGEGVTSVKRGDRAIMVWRAPCGHCYYCMRGKPVLCDEALKIISSIYGSCDPWVDFPRLLNLCAAGKLKLDELISREYPLGGVNEPFRALEAGEVARSIVRF